MAWWMRAALSMQVLQLISGLPALFLDLRHCDAESGIWTLCNCGGQSVYYSRRSADDEVNLKAVDLVPVIPKYGGVGAHVPYLGCEGPMTFARFVHDEYGPSLVGFTGEAVPARQEWMQVSCPAWPHVYARIDVEPARMLDCFHANHVHAVAGDCLAELEMFARMVSIPFTGL